MFHKNLILIVSAAIFLSLTACNTDKQPDTSSSATPGTPASSTASASGNVQQILAKLKSHTTQAATSVKAKNFAKAKADFKPFEEDWSKVEDGVKASSKDAYKQIEDKLDAVNNSLVKPTKPDKAKATSSLQALEKTLDTYGSSFH
ncbi:MAG: hypothetical protein NVSMB70_11660 [Chamaesiphon sp.]